jgi:4-hydroxybenzoate polyprenyltransferase
MRCEMTEATPATTMAARPGTVRSLRRLLSCIRFDEVLVLQGSPLIGAVFSIGRLTTEKAMALSLLTAGSCCLVAHVFVLNDWFGMSADLKDPDRATGTLMTMSIGRTQIGTLCMALLALSLLLLSPLGSTTLIIALAIAGLSALYSAPASHMKGVPLLNSAIHLIGGMLHFLLGYSLFSAVDGRGLEIGCFFALVFVAGHLTHEARDRDVDLLNGISTNAVTFGKARSFAAGSRSLHDRRRSVGRASRTRHRPACPHPRRRALPPASLLVAADPARGSYLRKHPAASGALPRALRDHRFDDGRDGAASPLGLSSLISRTPNTQRTSSPCSIPSPQIPFVITVC